MSEYIPFIIIFFLFLICAGVLEISRKFTVMLNHYLIDKSAFEFYARDLREELQNIRNTLDEIRLDQV